MLEKLQNNRNALGLLFMLPAAAFLLLFLTYPLGLGTWLAFAVLAMLVTIPLNCLLIFW